jgi:hypothetical protein
MGHNRLGRLPKRQRWVEVVELLDAAPEQTSAIASAVVEAADNRLRGLADDPALTYCFWLLTRITWAARGAGFLDSLSRLGIDASPQSSTLGLISQVTDRVHDELSGYPSSGHFAEISSLSLRHALSETVAQQGPSLFDSSVDDVQRAFRTYSTPAGFGELAHRFFSDFLARTLRSFVDRELSNHIGGPAGIANVDQSLDFMQALDVHTRQSARIAQEFAGAWYSKHNWESKGEIAKDEAQRFVGAVLRKLRSELKREVAAA